MTESLQKTQEEYPLCLLSDARGSSATKAGKVSENQTRYSHFNGFLKIVM